ncbi:outer membrane lipoprotein-sorting protein [Marinomonas agarivorans]|nr:outer membrane lipoprotein-sorting protein [Marinomonas agarivorans]
MKLHTVKLHTVLVALTVQGAMITTPAIAETPEEQGLKVAQAVKQSNIGWKDSETSLKLVLRNAANQESTREVRSKTLEVEGDGDKSLSIFDHPRDVKGTAFLSFSHTTTPDDQWLYLPALKRVKRIASRNKSGPYMGSEFSYEDLASFEVEKYTYKLLGEKPCPAGTCYELEQYPTDKYSGYTRLISLIDKDEYRNWQTTFYDRKNSLLKTLTVDSFKQYQGQFWRAEKMTMVNHQTKKSTDVIFGEYKFGVGLKDSDFNKNSLKRAK